MATFTVKIHVGDVVKVLTVMEAAFDDPSELMTDVLLVMIRSTQLTFQQEGRPRRWDDLAESTERQRLRRALRARGSLERGSLALVGGLPILRDTGQLLQSIGGGANGPFRTADGFGESDETSAIIGTNRPGWQNQFPDSRGFRDAREFLLFQEVDEDDITAMAMDWYLRTGPYAGRAA